MTESLTLNELQAYLWVYWCLADGAAGHPTPTKLVGRRQRGGAKQPGLNTDVAGRIRAALPLNERLDKAATEAAVAKLHRLLLEEVRSATASTSSDSTATFQALLTSFSFSDGFPSDRSPRNVHGMELTAEALHDSSSGFVEANQALWFRPGSEDSAERLGSSLDNPRTAFAEGKTFAKKILAFPGTERFHQLRNGDVNIAKVLSADQKEFLRRFGAEVGDVPFRGTVIIGRDPEFVGVTWIGVRENERYAQLSAKQRGRLLTATPQCVRTISPKTPARWVYGTRMTEMIDELRPEEFHAFALELGRHALTDDSCSIRYWPNYGRKGYGPELLRLERDEIVVAVSNGVATEFEDQVISALPSGFTGAVHILGREQLPGEISDAPETWSTHLGKNMPFAIIRPDQDEQRLAQFLLPRGRGASEGVTIALAIDDLVGQAVEEFQPIASLDAKTVQEFVLRLARAIDPIVRAHRHAGHPDTSPTIVRDQEQWVRRVLDPRRSLANNGITLWLLLDNAGLALQPSIAAWHAALATDPEEFAERLNASVRRMIFQRRMPVLEAPERPEIAILPETPERVLWHEGQKQLRAVAHDIHAVSESDATVTKEAAEFDSVRDLEDRHVMAALLAEPYFLLGRRGSGVSTSIYQLVRRLHCDAFVIAITPSALADGMAAHEWALCSDIIEHLLQERDVVIVGTCDADEEISPQVVRRTAALREKFGPAPHKLLFRIGLYVDNPAAIQVAGDARLIRLGLMGATYAEGLARHVATTLGVEVEDRALTAYGDALKDCAEANEIVRFFFTELLDNRLTLIRATNLRAPASLGPWAAQARALRMNVAREYDLLVLQVIISIELLASSPAPRVLVQHVVDSIATPATKGRSEWRFAEALHRLTTEGWLEDRDWPDPLALLTCLHPHSALGDLRTDLVKWLLENRSLVPTSDWQNMLARSASMGVDDSSLLRIVDVVESTFEPGTDVVITFVTELVRAGHLERAASLLDRYGGETPRAEKAWLQIAERHLWNGTDEIGLLRALGMLDGGTLAKIVTDNERRLSGNFPRLASIAKQRGHLPVLQQIAAILDTIRPGASPRFSDRMPVQP
jgi:hypothetical protein